MDTVLSFNEVKTPNQAFEGIAGPHSGKKIKCIHFIPLNHRMRTPLRRRSARVSRSTGSHIDNGSMVMEGDEGDAQARQP